MKKATTVILTTIITLIIAAAGCAVTKKLNNPATPAKLPPEKPAPTAIDSWPQWSPAAWEAARAANRPLLVVQYNNPHCDAFVRGTLSQPETREITKRLFHSVRADATRYPWFPDFLPCAAVMSHDGVVSHLMLIKPVDQPRDFLLHAGKAYENALSGTGLRSLHSFMTPDVPRSPFLEPDFIFRPAWLNRPLTESPIDPSRDSTPAFISNVSSFYTDAGVTRIAPAAFLLFASRYHSANTKKTLDTLARNLSATSDKQWGGFFTTNHYYVPVGAPAARYFDKTLSDNAETISFLIDRERATATAKTTPAIPADAAAAISYIMKFLGTQTGLFYDAQSGALADPASSTSFIPGKTFYSKPSAQRAKIGMPPITHTFSVASNAQFAQTLFKASDYYSIESYRLLAANITDALIKLAIRPDTGTAATWLDSESLAPSSFGLLRDNSALLSTLISAYEATGKTRYLTTAINLANSIFTNFSPDTKSPGFSYGSTGDPVFDKLIAGYTPVTTNIQLAATLDRLYHITGDKKLYEKSTEILKYFAVNSKKAPYIWNGPEYAQTVFSHTKHLKICVIGPKSHKNTEALRRAAMSYYEPVRITMTIDPKTDSDILATLPYGSRPQPTIFACVDTACSMPITDPATARATLATFTKNYLIGSSGNPDSKLP